MTIRVTNTRCVGLTITDLSYEAEIIKVNKKSIRTNKGTFTLRKVFEDGTKLYKNDLGLHNEGKRARVIEEEA